MNDHDLLDVLADEAPAPPQDHTTTVLHRAHRARSRRRAAALLGTATVVAAVVAGGSLALQDSGPRQAGPAPSVPIQHPPGQSPPDQRRVTSVRADALAAAIRAIIGDGHEDAPPVLYVLDHTCAGVVTHPGGACARQPIPPALRRELSRSLRTFAPVTFIADARTVTGSVQDGLVIRNGGALITLGRDQVGVDRATVPLSAQWSGMDGRGSTYELRRHAGRWEVDGTTGSSWIA